MRYLDIRRIKPVGDDKMFFIASKWLPESFKQGMAEAEAGELVDLDTALNKPYPGDQ